MSHWLDYPSCTDPDFLGSLTFLTRSIGSGPFSSSFFRSSLRVLGYLGDPLHKALVIRTDTQKLPKFCNISGPHLQFQWLLFWWKQHAWKKTEGWQDWNFSREYLNLSSRCLFNTFSSHSCSFSVFPEDNYVIHLLQNLIKFHVLHWLLHQTLESHRSSCQNLDNQNCRNSKGRWCVLYIFKRHRNLAIPAPQVQHTELLGLWQTV